MLHLKLLVSLSLIVVHLLLLFLLLLLGCFQCVVIVDVFFHMCSDLLLLLLNFLLTLELHLSLHLLLKLELSLLVVVVIIVKVLDLFQIVQFVFQLGAALHLWLSALIFLLDLISLPFRHPELLLTCGVLAYVAILGL